MSDFSLSIARWADRTKNNLDLVCRVIAIELHKRIVLRSPVGNPELWAANADAQYRRETHNLFVSAINATLEPGEKKVRPLGRKKLAQMYRLTAGKNYVGGRFRGSWAISVGAASTKEPGRIDPGGAQTIAEESAKLAGFTAGPAIYLTSNVPYAVRLEYGWSKQAPAGMVRITVQEFGRVVSEATRALPRA